MSEVRYSVNGKYFKDFGTYISSSEGLFDALKRKPVNTYDWAEYHGSSPDLSNPKFEQREITLKGFVTGSNWETMKSNFDAIVSEFQKAGTQRLLIEPFGLNSLPYEVCMIDEVKLQKEFKNGQMVGTFTLKLIEPNPIKKVLYFTGNTLNLSYDCPNETEIFYGNGLKETAKGNVSLSGKTLQLRSVIADSQLNRNYAIDSFYNKDQGVTNTYVFHTVVKITKAGFYTISVKGYNAGSKINMVLSVMNGEPIRTEILWNNAIDSFTYHFGVGEYLIRLSATAVFHLDWIAVVQGSVGPKEWTRDLESQKYIIIAGNIEEITGLTTNADVLWEKL